ncbi:2'-5' RNA ligase [Aneurinibacillus soli]|uniref:RNA 2',3'-cyclic phosphodiesterase n=1 Tax=Aneurinibacillus soli TaxID=1500254 RepID=A0A0U5BCF8_9BACL|nr:RNA 2',3'-cyclic phosphodiesterase [Aneurinibacillus soli]PYE61729.1 2'-5' RNA ligase [Aneurinibacillus soli]BAU28413.1 2',5' RNA ligase family [Aneurinibacillus soli]
MRLFTAIEPSPAARQAIEHIERRLKTVIRCKRWQPVETIHLTMQFLGEKQEADLPQIDQALQTAVKGIPPISLHIGPPGVFGHTQRARVLWLSLNGETDALKTLQKQTAEALTEAGLYKEDKPFRPHITLGRNLETPFELEEVMALFRHTPLTEWTVEALHLYRSTLTPAGAIHHKLKTYPLIP